MEIVAREQAGRVLRVAERHVDEDALHDDEDRGAVDGDADDGRDPVDVRVCGPGEDEEPEGGPEGGEEGGFEAGFLRAQAAFEDVGDEVEVEVGDVGDDAQEAGDEDTGEDDANHAGGETVHGRVDEREDFEEGVVDAVDEGGVEVHERDGGVLDGDFDRFDQRVENDSGRLEALLVDFRLRFEAGVAGEFTQARRAAEEDVRGRGFGDAEEHEDEDGGGEPEDFPQRPAPAFSCDGEAGDKGAKSGTTVGGGDPDGERIGEFKERVHVLHCRTAVGEAGAAEEALEETEDEEAGEVVDESGGDR